MKNIKFPLILCGGYLAMNLHEQAYACSVCFGDPSSSLTSGLRAGIFSLLAILCVVLGSFGYFFWKFYQHNKKFPGPI